MKYILKTESHFFLSLNTIHSIFFYWVRYVVRLFLLPLLFFVFIIFFLFFFRLLTRYSLKSYMSVYVFRLEYYPIYFWQYRCHVVFYSFSTLLLSSSSSSFLDEWSLKHVPNLMFFPILFASFEIFIILWKGVVDFHLWYWDIYISQICS